MTACRNLAFRSAMHGIWTFYPTGSGRPFGLLTGILRPTRRLVTNQSVEATPGVAGARWYEIRRNGAGIVQLVPAGDVRSG